MTDTSAAQPRHWRTLLRKKERSEVVMGYATVMPVSGAVAWGLWALAGWLEWLYWPVLILAGFTFHVFIAVAVNALRMQVKRADTATQTLRAASQGRIELIGTVRPIEGTLVSPLYGVPCVAFNAWFSARDASGELVTAREKVLPAAVLLTDGDREAFLPVHEADEVAMRVELAQLDASRELLRQDIREELGDGGKISARLEEVVPADKPMQVNGVFRTLSSGDSYRTVVNAHVGLIPPTEEELEKDAVEQAWRRFCRRREAEAGGAGPVPVPVDAILPVTHFKGIGIVRVADADWRLAADVVANMVMFAVPFGYLLLRLLDLTGPLPLLF
ncbi:hypothetical protein ACM64Y_12000 [Novispirillum sp. DQ9]|uniref:hypothetical protein n=1 Tax=Novispirillum sp. DQ9 TaxID=3398612 RepID=UPI003C7AA5AB